jgi:hypothetical protein
VIYFACSSILDKQATSDFISKVNGNPVLGARHDKLCVRNGSSHFRKIIDLPAKSNDIARLPSIAEIHPYPWELEQIKWQWEMSGGEFWMLKRKFIQLPAARTG